MFSFIYNFFFYYHKSQSNCNMYNNIDKIRKQQKRYHNYSQPNFLVILLAINGIIITATAKATISFVKKNFKSVSKILSDVLKYSFVTKLSKELFNKATCASACSIGIPDSINSLYALWVSIYAITSPSMINLWCNKKTYQPTKTYSSKQAQCHMLFPSINNYLGNLVIIYHKAAYKPPIESKIKLTFILNPWTIFEILFNLFSIPITFSSLFRNKRIHQKKTGYCKTNQKKHNYALVLFGNLYIWLKNSITLGKLIIKIQTANISKVKKIFKLLSMRLKFCFVIISKCFKSSLVATLSKDEFKDITFASACEAGIPESIKSLYICRVLTCSIISPTLLVKSIYLSLLDILAYSNHTYKTNSQGIFRWQ